MRASRPSDTSPASDAHRTAPPRTAPPRPAALGLCSAAMLDAVKQLEERALAELKDVADADALEAFRIRYLGSKGELKALMGRMKDVPKADKPAFGQAANAAKQLFHLSEN